MKATQLLFLSVIAFATLSYTFVNPSDLSKSESKKWVSLFNGKNLDNWKPKIVGHALGENFGNTFRVKDGVLSVRYDEYGNFDNRFGALYYNKKFTNYRLRVEYRFVGETTPGAPSWGYRDGGIQYHCQNPASIGLSQPFPVCLEYNLHGGNGKDERPVGQICASGIQIKIDGKKNASYCTAPTIKKTIHGDEWAIAEIEVRNGKVTHFINGEKIIEFSDPQFDSTHAIGKTFIRGKNQSVKSGYISLQSNSHPMDFRKIEIKAL